jgi:hypothetical protein
MTACPDIEELLRAPVDPQVLRHCRVCAACDAISALSALRQVQSQARSGDEQHCISAEISIAEAVVRGRAPNAAHLEDCAACGEVAVRAQALPRIEADVTFVEAQNVRPLLTPLRLAVSAMALMLVAMVAALALRTGEPSEPAPIVLQSPPSQAPASTARLPATATVRLPATATEPLPPPAPLRQSDPAVGARPATAPRLANPYFDSQRGYTIRDGGERVWGVDDAGSPSPAASADVGYLTVVCDPFCDRILVDGRLLGSSPLVRARLAPGVHRVDLIRDSLKKRITVSIVAGQITARRVKMTRSDLEAIE